MRNTNIHKVLMCTITAMLFCGFGWSVLHVRHFINNAMEGKGHVVNLVKTASKNGYVFKPVVEFWTVGGTSIEFTSSTGTSPPSYDVGENVTVYYDPKDPHAAILSDWFSIWGLSMIIGALAVAFGFITYILYFRVTLKPSRKRR
ncbi:MULTISPECIES: DUF3592 domain-containing protein [unclassified Phyllobacterium]|uniref:DUF3592 domain-containing protein n=1 Tax=unclassified Phyllobacterium TaxID=2638441 RepID=UPI000E0E59D1